MKLGVVCVHYHAAELAGKAEAAIRRDAEDSGLAYEMVVVDNGSSEADRGLLRNLESRVLTAEGNLGYAGGLNLGARALLPGVDVLVAMNPDVWVEPGCLERLTRELHDGAAVAGPRFYWDEVGGYQLPPTESYGPIAELRRSAASRGGFWTRSARLAWRRHARRHWQTRDAVTSWDLSGALLAISAEAWDRVGPFDEGYRLYFEETDWLHRCRRLGLSGRFVGSAAAVHLYAQSTPREPRAQRWFAESAERFRRLHGGPVLGPWLGRISDALSADLPSAERDRSVAPIFDPRTERLEASDGSWVEISPAEAGFPAAAKRVMPSKWLDPESPDPERLVSERLWSQMAPGTYWLRTVSASGKESDARRFVKEATG